MPRQKNKIIMLLLGDLGLLFFSLYLTLTIRYREELTPQVWEEHLWPFLFISILWLFIFYISGFYDTLIFSSFKKTLERVLKAMAAATVIAAVIFYLAINIDIAPKTNLFLHALLTTVFLILWRRVFWTIEGKGNKIKTLFLGNSKEVEELYNILSENTRYGYEPVAILNEVDENLAMLIKKHNTGLVVALKSIMQDPKSARYLYEALPLQFTIIEFTQFYESLTEKVPISIINETWFLENLSQINKKGLSFFKRFFDIIVSVLLGIPTLIIFPVIAVLSKIESKDKIIVKQERVGKNEKSFILIKFRTMYKATYANEKEGNKLSGLKTPDDPRLTKIGSFLRKFQIDELPQIWNVLKGEMSFVGPRPERPKFVDGLKREIPHYSIRHLVKPGLTGWAQVKFRHSASVSAKDTMEKLQYDLYYIKNRSLVLELAIAAKTIITMLSHKGR